VHQMHSSCLDQVKRFREFITTQCSKLECLSVPNIFERDLFRKDLTLNGRSLHHSQTLGLTGESNKNTLAYYTALPSNIRLDWINLSAQNTLGYNTVLPSNIRLGYPAKFGSSKHSSLLHCFTLKYFNRLGEFQTL
jgi:hypothetical protein